MDSGIYEWLAVMVGILLGSGFALWLIGSLIERLIDKAIEKRDPLYFINHPKRLGGKNENVRSVRHD